MLTPVGRGGGRTRGGSWPLKSSSWRSRAATGDPEAGSACAQLISTLGPHQRVAARGAAHPQRFPQLELLPVGKDDVLQRPREGILTPRCSRCRCTTTSCTRNSCLRTVPGGARIASAGCTDRFALDDLSGADPAAARGSALPARPGAGRVATPAPARMVSRATNLETAAADGRGQRRRHPCWRWR